jgi:hypothetical protein
MLKPPDHYSHKEKFLEKLPTFKTQLEAELNH